eukprot:COSAG02_NODE_8015_length_2745_cov_2.602672_3_plen_77_part_00
MAIDAVHARARVVIYIRIYACMDIIMGPARAPRPRDRTEEASPPAARRRTRRRERLNRGARAEGAGSCTADRRYLV